MLGSMYSMYTAFLPYIQYSAVICEPLISQPTVYARENFDHLTDLDHACCASKNDRLSVDNFVLHTFHINTHTYIYLT